LPRQAGAGLPLLPPSGSAGDRCFRLLARCSAGARGAVALDTALALVGVSPYNVGGREAQYLGHSALGSRPRMPLIEKRDAACELVTVEETTGPTARWPEGRREQADGDRSGSGFSRPGRDD
jgi:hypothetical protein